MTDREQHDLHMKHPASLGARMLQGAGIGAVLIGLTFTLGVNLTPGYYNWMLLPLLLVPFAGALSGTIFFYTDPLRVQGGSRKIVANVISVLAFLLLVTLAFMLGMQSMN